MRPAYSKEEVVERLKRRATTSDAGCWLLPIQKGHDGYVRVNAQSWGGFKYAHRVVFAHTHCQPIDNDLTIDHLCRNRNCINPDHLELVPLLENLARRPFENKGMRTHCRKGHQYDGRNSLNRATCSSCSRDARRRYKAKQKREVAIAPNRGK